MLSAIVITHNEEPVINRCLNSLSFADEIIVIDANSTDQTVAFAQQHGARVYSHSWSGYGPQKNFGAAQARGDWLLFVDADEQVPPILAQTITNLVNSSTPAPTFDFYWLRIVTIFLHRPLRHLYGHNPRLFKKTSGHWNNASVHEQVLTSSGNIIALGDDMSGLISSPLLHYSHPTISSYLKKMHRYTTLDAKQMLLTNQHRSGRLATPSTLLPYKLYLRQLFKLLLYRRGALDGISGIIWCFLSAYYEFEMARKYINYSKTASNS